MSEDFMNAFDVFKGDFQKNMQKNIKISVQYECERSGEPLAIEFTNKRIYYCRCRTGKFERIYLDGHRHKLK